MRKTMTIAVLLLAVGTAQSQTYKRGYKSLFPEFGNFQNRGWIISPGINFLVPGLKSKHQRLWTDNHEVYEVVYNGSGKMGLGLEVGRFHKIDGSHLLSYVSLSAGLKHLRGVERFVATLDDPDRAMPSTRRGDGVFSHTNATMSFDLSNAKQFSERMFMENSIGVNGDYRITESMRYNTQGLPITLNNPSRFIFQAHYRLGFGIKLSQNIFVVPSVETPVVTFYEYDDLKSTLSVFNSRYRPLIVRVQVMLLDRKADRKCPSNGPAKRRGGENLFGMVSTHPW